MTRKAEVLRDGKQLQGSQSGILNVRGCISPLPRGGINRHFVQATRKSRRWCGHEIKSRLNAVSTVVARLRAVGFHSLESQCLPGTAHHTANMTLLREGLSAGTSEIWGPSELQARVVHCVIWLPWSSVTAVSLMQVSTVPTFG